MKAFVIFALCTLAALLNTVLAKGKKEESPEEHAYRILQVNAVSITVSFSKTGRGGAEHATYAITDATVVTIDGHPTNARELKSGMVTHLTIAPDQKTVTKIEARDAPRAPEKGHVG